MSATSVVTVAEAKEEIKTSSRRQSPRSPREKRGANRKELQRARAASQKTKTRDRRSSRVDKTTLKTSEGEEPDWDAEMWAEMDRCDLDPEQEMMKYAREDRLFNQLFGMYNPYCDYFLDD
jgi:hypothetical protein